MKALSKQEDGLISQESALDTDALQEALKRKREKLGYSRLGDLPEEEK